VNVVRGTIAAVLVAVAVGAFATCSSKGNSGDSAVRSPTATVLQIRGVVRQLPRRASAPLLIEHEAISEFIDFNGNRAPMEAMTMPFEITDEALLAGLEVGDPVVFLLEIDWEESPSIVISSIEKLPAGTDLDLAKPDAASDS
jgi:Cu/Ag efflux protein CusF